MDENEVKVENSDEVTFQDYNEVKVQDSDEVIVQDFNEVKVEDSNENIVQVNNEIENENNNDVVQDATISNDIESNSYAYQENNEIKVENNNESQNKRKPLIIVVIILVLILLGLVGYFVYDKFFKNKVESDNYTKEYYNLNDVKKEKITKEEFLSRVKKYNATCGVIGQKDDDGNPETCNNSNWFNYEAYINNGTPYYMFNAQICDDEGACTDDEENFEVYNFSEIKNVKQIASKVDQYNGVEFAYELNNGDVYYFTPLFDEITIDGSKHDTHLVKLNLPAKLKRFSNVGNGQATYGTEIVLELENNEKYVVEYNYETNKATLTKYDEYYNKYHKFDDSIELSSDEKTLKLSSEILYSDKLNDIINNNKIISDNIKEQEYDGICPQISLNINNERLHFHILQISNTKVFLYTNNDNSDGKKIEVYGLDEEGKLNYAKFFAVDYEDTKNHSLELIKYDVKNIESIALITVSDESNMLTDNEIPNAPYNYAIFKAKDGKYYTDYSLDKDKKVLREVKYDGTDYGTSITSNISDFKLYGEGLISKNLNSIINKSKFVSSNLSANTRYPSITAKNKNTKYTIKSISNPVAILYSDNDNSDSGIINAYIFDNKKNLYYAKFSSNYIEYSANKENHDLKIYKFNVSNIVSYTLIKATSKEEMLTDVEDVYSPYNYVIFKTKDGKYYTDYSKDVDEIKLRQVSQVVEDSNVVNLNINITERKESEFVQENKEQAAQYENVDLIDLTKIRSELNKKIKSIGKVYNDNPYVIIKIENGQIILDTTVDGDYDSDGNKIWKNEKLIINSIPNPVGIYAESTVLGGEDGYPMQFFVLDNSNNVYIVSLMIRDADYNSIVKLVD